MGDLQAFLLQTNGRIGDYNPPPPSNPHPSAVTDECWRQAEIATEETLHRIQPSLVSEERRRAVVEYVHKLVRGNIGSEVFPFGSVPLKTYLPDGDIDLTTLGVPNSEDTLASEVRSILEGEERNPDAEFEVKDVQYIHAEVKLVKCMVQNIVVDISFNQIGGLSTLCFLEQVDRHIGKNSLFKRSIILIKAWCYYESRILGAHHGLISTYALETLVLYIFHLFHSSLNGPLAVLYRFLDFFSKFDWDNYCVSLHGPISLSSLPELVAEAPENDGGDLLLSREFLRSCVDKYSDPQRGLENNSRSFSKKHMNVLDPLKENNNLGRSVNKGNFYRIRSAFTYGARKLGQILLLPAESIAHEINTYFMNTLDRHGSGERPDVRDVLPRCLSEGELREGIDGIKISSSDMENRTSSSIASNETYETSSTNSDVSANASPHGPHLRAYHDPHLYLGHEKNWYEKGVPTKGFVTDEETSSSPSVLDFYDAESSWCNNSGISASGSIDGLASSTEGTPKLSNHLGDLTGDYGTHFQSLLYAQSCRDYFMSTHFIPIPRSFPSQYRNKYPSDAVRRRNTYPQMNPNGMIPRPPFSPPVFYPRRPPGVYNMDEIQKPRGTGTYFPNTNYLNRERQSPGRRSPVANQLQHLIPDGNNRVNPTLLEAPKSPHTSPKGFPHGNGSSHRTDRMIEFGTLDPVALGASSQEIAKKFGGKHQGYGSTDIASTSQKPTTSSTQERPRQAYKLKDNTDFPPLRG